MATLDTFLIATFTVVAVTWLLNFWRKNREFYELAAKIPQTDGHLPLIGIAHKVIETKTKNLYVKLCEVFSGSVSPRKVFFGPKMIVVVDDPEQLQLLLNSKFCREKPSMYKGAFFEKGLISANEKMWKVHYKLLQPALTSKVLKNTLLTFNEKTKIFLEVVQKQGEVPFDIHKPISSLAIDTIFQSSMGFDKKIQTEGDIRYQDHLNKAAILFGAFMFKLWLRFWPIFRFSKYYSMQQDHVVNGVRKISDTVLRSRKLFFEENPRVTNEEEGDKPQILIDQLLKNKDELSDDEINDEINTIILAGSDTTGIMLANICLLMAFFPDMQEKIFQELQTVFVTQDQDVTEKEISELVYLDLVIKETLRFWAVLPFFGRKLTQNVDIGPNVLPAGTEMCIPIVHIHRNKKVWGDDADQFKPERFLPENFVKIPTFAFIPFARGSRNCIGERYAMMQMKVFLAHFFRNFKVSTELKLEGMTFNYGVTMKLDQSRIVTLQRRSFE